MQTFLGRQLSWVAPLLNMVIQAPSLFLSDDGANSLGRGVLFWILFSFQLEIMKERASKSMQDILGGKPGCALHYFCSNPLART